MKPVYRQIFPAIKAVAKKHGYAIGQHGSMIRDMDLIACPWTDDASSPKVLVNAVVEEVKKETGTARCIDYPMANNKWPGQVLKPHGRMAFTITMADGCWIDLSVMPKKKIRKDKA